MTSLPAVAWVLCARCMAEIFADPKTLPAFLDLPGDGPRVYCAQCRRVIDAETAARPCVKGARCVHVDYQHGPFAERIVTQVDGDWVRVMVLGFPGGVPEGAHAYHHSVGREWFHRGELIMSGPA